MTGKNEGDPRYRSIIAFLDRSEKQKTLSGVYWVVCPKHGVGEAVRVVRWTKALSDEMHHVQDAAWFIRGRYTTGQCHTCDLTLPVTRKKPAV